MRYQILDIAHGLEYLHSSAVGIIHGDLKGVRCCGCCPRHYSRVLLTHPAGEYFGRRVYAGMPLGFWFDNHTLPARNCSRCDKRVRILFNGAMDGPRTP